MPFDPEAFAGDDFDALASSQMEGWAQARDSMFEFARSLPAQVNGLALNGVSSMVGDRMETIGAQWSDALASYDGIMDRAVDDCGRMVLDKARELSGYEYFSLPELARMGHPYAVRFPENSAGIPDYLISMHTGLFWGDWTVVVDKLGGECSIELTNQAGYSKFLFSGTSRMRRRPINEAAFSMTKDARDARLAEAAKEADP